MKNILIIGAGGVGSVTAHKCAQNNDQFGAICLASRTLSKCESIKAQILARGNLKNPQGEFNVKQIDAMNTNAVVQLIQDTDSQIVINVGSPYCNLSILNACLETGADYIDTAVHETEGEMNMPAPWYANYEWKLKQRCEQAGITAILGIGFDPGVVNVFCAWAAKHQFDDIESIDILDVNGGDHGRYFATNFDPETNLREILEDVIYWENNEWQTIPCHSRSRVYDFPELGEYKVYSMGHDEIHSLYQNIPAKHIEFWMGFGEQYLNVFDVLKNLGLISNEVVDVEGSKVQPLKLLKAVLPDPASLAEGYTGRVCIGSLVTGKRQTKRRSLFIYSVCDHKDCFNDVGSQAISYTTGVPVVTAALLLANGTWQARKMVNVEELDPDPFLALMPTLGIDWQVRED